MRNRLTSLSFVTCFLVTSVLAAMSHVLIANSLGYASYWWMNRLTWPESDPTLHLLFVLLPIPAVFLGLATSRRLSWFPLVAAVCLIVHALLRLIDESTGLFISRLAVPSEMYWLVPSVIYGLGAGIGTMLGLVLATRAKRRAQRVFIQR